MQKPNGRDRIEVFRRDSIFPGDFPLALNRVHAHAECRMHTHDFSELVVVLRGRGLHVTPSASWPIGAGDVFVLHGDQAHGYVDTAGLDIVNIMYSSEEMGLPTADIASLPGYHVLFTLEPLYRNRDRFESRLRLSQEKLREVGTLIDRLEHETAARPPAWRYTATACFMLLIADLSRQYAHVDAPAALPLQRLGGVISHIEQHYPESPTLEELAGVGCMSRRSLTRAFRAALGCSPVQYMVRLKIARALELLQETDDSITDIAFRVGYRDGNYFTRQFRATVGQTPSQARRQAARAHSL